MSRRAWSTVSLLPAHSWSIRSPPIHSGARPSLGNGCMAVSRMGRRAASPKRSSKRVDDTPRVTVRRVGGDVGSERAAVGRRARRARRTGGTPPAVRNRARRGDGPQQARPGSARSSAVTSRATKAAAGGAGVRIPAWWRPVEGNGAEGGVAPAPRRGAPGVAASASSAPDSAASVPRHRHRSGRGIDGGRSSRRRSHDQNGIPSVPVNRGRRASSRRCGGHRADRRGTWATVGPPSTRPRGERRRVDDRGGDVATQGRADRGVGGRRVR